MDFGSGNGDYTLILARAVGEEGKVYAVDKNKEVLDELIERVHEKGFGNIEEKKVSEETETPTEIPLPDESIDAGWFSDVLHDGYFKDEQKEELLRDVYRILKEDGFIAVHPVHMEKERLKRVKDECKDVLFAGKAEPVKAEEAISDIKEQKEDLDGLLVFGPPPDELIEEGLPTVAVERPLEGCTTVPFHAYKDSKVVTSYLPAHRDKEPKVYSLRIEDIAGKIKLIDTVSKMKGLRVLVVTDQPTLGYFEPIGLQIEKGREEYEKVYLDNLKEVFGTEFVTIPQKELFEKMRAEDESEAKEIAQKWIKEAIALRWTNEAEVIKSAKMYLAMKELMEKYSCGAITVEGFGYPPLGYQRTVEEDIPSAGLSVSQFLTDGIAAATETLTDCLITQQLGLYLTGSGGLLGDYNIDPFTNISTDVSRNTIPCRCSRDAGKIPL